MARGAPGLLLVHGSVSRSLAVADVVRARVAVVRETVPLTATLDALRSSEIAAEIEGRVREVRVREGERVRRGQVLVQLDDTLQQAQRDQANQIRQRAQAMLLQLSQEKNLLYQKVGSFRAVASHLEQLERQLRSSMPQHVMDMLGQQAEIGRAHV